MEVTSFYYSQLKVVNDLVVARCHTLSLMAPHAQKLLELVKVAFRVKGLGFIL